MMKAFVAELINDVAPLFIAMESTPNFEELKSKAEEMAAAEYKKYKDTDPFKSIYTYIMESYFLEESEFVKDFLADAYLLKIAKERKLTEVEEYARWSLIRHRNGFEDKEDAEETAAYEFFDEKLQ